MDESYWWEPDYPETEQSMPPFKSCQQLRSQFWGRQWVILE